LSRKNFFSAHNADRAPATGTGIIFFQAGYPDVVSAADNNPLTAMRAKGVFQI
jgi:hypothetical protein